MELVRRKNAGRRLVTYYALSSFFFLLFSFFFLLCSLFYYLSSLIYLFIPLLPFSHQENLNFAELEAESMKIGDRVAVVDDQVKGIIRSLQGTRVTLEDEHGFTYEYGRNEVVLQNAALYEQVPVVRKKEATALKSQKHLSKPFVLDLHFERLVPNTRQYDAAERLFLQRKKLLETINYCRQNHLKRLEIIHGIGDGVLQEMVHDVLESQAHLEFHNKEILHHQSGAVLVYFR